MGQLLAFYYGVLLICVLGGFLEVIICDVRYACLHSEKSRIVLSRVRVSAPGKIYLFCKALAETSSQVGSKYDVCSTVLVSVCLFLPSGDIFTGLHARI